MRVKMVFLPSNAFAYVFTFQCALAHDVLEEVPYVCVDLVFSW